MAFLTYIFALIGVTLVSFIALNYFINILDKQGEKQKVQRKVDIGSNDIITKELLETYTKDELEYLCRVSKTIIIINNNKVQLFVETPFKVFKGVSYYTFYNDKGQRISLYY